MSQHQSPPQSASSTPLVVAEQGSFFVGGTVVRDPESSIPLHSFRRRAEPCTPTTRTSSTRFHRMLAVCRW